MQAAGQAAVVARKPRAQKLAVAVELVAVAKRKAIQRQAAVVKRKAIQRQAAVVKRKGIRKLAAVVKRKGIRKLAAVDNYPAFQGFFSKKQTAKTR